jgi:hypothetical protein
VRGRDSHHTRRAWLRLAARFASLGRVHPDDVLPAGWLTQFRRGVLSGAGLLLLAVGLCAVPAFLVWLVPSGDTTPASTAVKAGALLALSAAHGGLRLNGTEVTLVPLLVTFGLAWLVAGQSRRSESWSTVLGLVLGYGIASGLLAGWATLGSTRAPAVRSMLAAWAFTAVVGGVARGLDAGWPRLPERWQRMFRAAGGVLCCYLLAGSLLAMAALAAHFQDAAGIQHQLAPGTSGLPIALLGVAATPNAVLAAVGYLTGPGFAIGSHTAVSATAVSHGPLPLFPLLAGVPHGRPLTVLGLLAITALALISGRVMLALIAIHDSWLARLTDAIAATVLAGGLLAVLSALASGGIGAGSLGVVGPVWWEVGASSMLAVLFGAALWLSVEVARGKAAGSEHETLATVARLVPSLRPVPQADVEDEPVRAESVGRTRNAG